MDDLDHSMRIAEYDWVSFYDDSEECGLLQPSLAWPDNSSLSDSEDSELKFNAGQQEPRQNPAANSDEAESNAAGCCMEEVQINQSGSAGEQDLAAKAEEDTLVKPDVWLGYAEGNTMKTEEEVYLTAEETNESVTTTLQTDVKRESDTSIHGPDLLCCNQTEEIVKESHTSDRAASEGVSIVTLRAEKERWFVTLNDIPARQRTDESKPGRSSCDFSSSDFEEEYWQFLGTSRNSSPDPQSKNQQRTKDSCFFAREEEDSTGSEGKETPVPSEDFAGEGFEDQDSNEDKVKTDSRCITVYDPEDISVAPMFDYTVCAFRDETSFSSLSESQCSEEKPIPIFSCCHPTVRELTIPNPGYVFLSAGCKERGKISPIKVVSRSLIQDSSYRTSAAVGFHSWKSFLSIRKIRFQDKGSIWCSESGAWVFPAEAEKITIKTADPPITAVIEGTVCSTPSQLCRELAMQQRILETIQTTRREGIFSTLKQSDMCLVCIAFASWVLRSSDPEAADTWKAALLANVSALSAIQYLRQYVKKKKPFQDDP
ncbi:hypothetical protein D5F01_LYC03009 [Larimichthys crocea]|uniref:PGC-1 and ERR-induced regulator in muscle protein 1 n=1 Tax=Larimichthys crocea TaxID=215358 RepID=A0A6G0J439_LARCR|nr:hypothetical protein D5F01_LYC03009 [Larimichthys crocea]